MEEKIKKIKISVRISMVLARWLRRAPLKMVKVILLLYYDYRSHRGVLASFETQS